MTSLFLPFSGSPQRPSGSKPSLRRIPAAIRVPRLQNNATEGFLARDISPRWHRHTVPLPRKCHAPGDSLCWLFHITAAIKIAVVSIQCAYLRPFFLREATLQELLGQQIALFITLQFTVTAAGHRLADDVRLAFCLTALLHGVAPNFQKGFEGLSVFLGFFERKSLVHLVHHGGLAEVLRCRRKRHASKCRAEEQRK